MWVDRGASDMHTPDDRCNVFEGTSHNEDIVLLRISCKILQLVMDDNKATVGYGGYVTPNC